MGLQVRCPLCGMSRTPENFQARHLQAKEVTSKGGNRGFDHQQVPVPTELERRIAAEVSVLHRRLGGPAEAVEAAVENVENSGEGDDAADTEAIKVDIDREVGRAVIEAEIEGAVDDGLEEKRTKKEVRDAVQRSIIEGQIEGALDQL